MNTKKGQLNLGNAPTIVLIVGLTFLVMATIALVGEKYGSAFPSGTAARVNNETITQAKMALGPVAVAGLVNCNAEDFAIETVYNSTTDVLAAGNYTLTTAGMFSNLTSDFSVQDWTATYTFNYAGPACNVTSDLQTEISNNTSIAGIVLTISLVGIVLTVLIGVFLGTRRVRI